MNASKASAAVGAAGDGNGHRSCCEEVKRLRKRIEELQRQVASRETEGQQSPDSPSDPNVVHGENAEALRLASVIIQRSPVILFRRLAGEDPRPVYVSENIERLGYFAREFTEGRVLYREIVHPEDRDRVREEIGRYAEQNVEEYTQRYRIITRDGDARWVEDQTTVVRDRHGNKLYNQGIIYDITERKQAEDRLKKSEEKFRRIIETTGEGFLMMDDQLRITQVNDAYCHMLGYSREELIGNSPLRLATPEFRQFMESHRDRLLAAEQRRMEGRLMAKDGHIVPVLIHGNTLRDSRGRKLGHISFISDLTYQKKALELAGRVQRSLAPQSAPTIPGLDIFGRSDACQEVGGDYYDFFFSSQDTPGGLKVVVGDISGHGVDAALHMTAARTLFRTRVVQPGTPTQIVSAMNRQLASDMAGTGHFMTLFYMEIDPVRRTADWIRAGHDPALVYLPGEDRFVELRGKGLPLGIEAGTDYPSHAFADLVPGAVIALGTDGIWEAANAEGAFFGRDRFQQILRDSAAGTARDIVQTVFDAVSDFTGGLPQEDDITLVVVKVVPEGPDVVI